MIRDELRQRLHDALAADCESVPCIQRVHWNDADRVLPVVEAAIAEARVDLQKEIARAIPGLYYAPRSISLPRFADGRTE